MLTPRCKAIGSAASLVAIILLGSVALRIAFGANYAGSTWANDVKMNIGYLIFAFFATALIVTYPLKFYFYPPVSIRNILLSVALIVLQPAILLLLFSYDMSPKFIATFLACGAACVLVVETAGYPILRNACRRDTNARGS